jgi:hypothetical protein
MQLRGINARAAIARAPRMGRSILVSDLPNKTAKNRASLSSRNNDNDGSKKPFF